VTGDNFLSAVAHNFVFNMFRTAPVTLLTITASAQAKHRGEISDVVRDVQCAYCPACCSWDKSAVLDFVLEVGGVTEDHRDGTKRHCCRRRLD
jgi:hypothetical protein